MTVGERIKLRMEKLGIKTSAELAKRAGVSRQTVDNWLKDIYLPKHPKVPRLAQILEIDASLLSPFGGGTAVPIERGHKVNYVLLIEWADLHCLGPGGKMKMSAIKRPTYIHADLDISADCRALRIHDNSMEIIDKDTARGVDSFRKGDLIIIDPSLAPTNGDYVLARLRQTGEHVFRLFIARARGAYDLVAENPEYPTVTVNSRFPCEIMGVLVEHRKKRHTR